MSVPDDHAVYLLSVRTGLAGGSYAPVERRLVAELLAAHTGEGVDRDAETTALLPADTADGKQRRWSLVVGASTASRFLATGPALVLFDRAEVSCDRRRSIAAEEFHVVDVGDATGRVLCERPDCACCGLATARARCRTAGYLWGLARASADAAVHRMKHRHQFGRAIGDNQAIAFRMAALAARLEAFGSLGEAVADRFADTAEPLRHVSELLAGCADLALAASAESLHLHGVAGLLSSDEAQRRYSTAQAFSVRHGTPSRLRLESRGHGRGESR
jgi:alkylation response protein AidB-like acyl-CoA dehydrogenase